MTRQDKKKMANVVSPRPDRLNPMENPKLRIEGVSFYYGKGMPFETKALDDVSIDIRPGVLTGIIGHTGSGKSTLVNLFNGLQRPDEGRVLLDGEDIWKEPKKIGKIRFRVGLVMQYPEYQLFEETVAADIAFGPKNMKLSPQDIQARVDRAVRFVGLAPDLLSQSPFDLSGGQKRRAAIAGVMAMEPEVLVLDEPAAGLDPQGRKAIFEGIREYNRQTGCTVIIVSHSMEDMAQYCDDVVVMAHAKCLMAGTRDEIFTRAAELTEVGLDIPQITKIAVLLHRAGLPVDPGLYSVDAVKAAIVDAMNT